MGIDYDTLKDIHWNPIERRTRSERKHYLCVPVWRHYYFYPGNCLHQFMNLSTARSSNRAKEVACVKWWIIAIHLMRQFLTESMLWRCSHLFWPSVWRTCCCRSSTISLRATAHTLWQSVVLCNIICSVFITGLMADYILVFFVGIQPQRYWKDMWRWYESGSIRSALVVFQFVISSRWSLAPSR